LTNTGIETRDHSIGETLDINRIEQVWSNYETEIVQSANKYGVPIELILTTISVESAGDSNANSGGNYGLMQIRLKTAQKSLPNKELVSADLFNPAIAIEAGTSYLKMQYEGKGWFRQSTNFDLPKVVAAYNSGRIYDAPSTPWGMKINAPSHIDKSVVYFNDALLFLSRQEDIPQMSFAAYFATQQ
jgi:soluble lytic murein transglycosylase-like protein